MMIDKDETRLMAAALECFVAYGIRKTTLDNVATRAGVSRSSVYRTLGPKDRVIERVAHAEVQRFLDEVTQALPVQGTLTDTVAELVDFALAWLRSAALSRRILEQEPEIVVDLLIERDDATPLVPQVAARLGTLLSKRPGAEQLRVPAEHAAEWLIRTVISMLLAPSGTLGDGQHIANHLLHGIAR